MLGRLWRHSRGIPRFFTVLFKAGLVIILYVVIQQLENQIIVPKVMQRSVGLSPLVIIIVMLIGARLAGVVDCCSLFQPQRSQPFLKDFLMVAGRKILSWRMRSSRGGLDRQKQERGCS